MGPDDAIVLVIEREVIKLESKFVSSALETVLVLLLPVVFIHTPDSLEEVHFVLEQMASIADIHTSLILGCVDYVRCEFFVDVCQLLYRLDEVVLSPR